MGRSIERGLLKYRNDPSVANWRQFGRLPGVTNCKAKYKRRLLKIEATDDPSDGADCE